MKFFGSQINPQRIRAKRPPQISEIPQTTSPQTDATLDNTEIPSTFEFKVISEASLQNEKKKSKLK